MFVSEAVRGEWVGVAESESGDWIVRFLHVELGRIDRTTRRFTAAWRGSRRTRKQRRVEEEAPAAGAASSTP